VWVQHFAELDQGCPHLGFHGADRSVPDLGYLFVSQFAVLPQEKDFFLLLAKLADGNSQPIEGFLILDRSARGVFPSRHHYLILRERAAFAVPRAPLEVFGSVEPNSEDPGPQVQDIRDGLSGTPALEKRFLGGILGIVRIAEQVQEGADEFIPDLIEHGDQCVVTGSGVFSGLFLDHIRSVVQRVFATVCLSGFSIIWPDIFASVFFVFTDVVAQTTDIAHAPTSWW
jgi:hypothetical protein